MFIKLTAWKRDSDGDPVYLNPLTVTSIKEGTLYTIVNTLDGVWDVRETPDEIMKMVDDKLSINKIVFR